MAKFCVVVDYDEHRPEGKYKAEFLHPAYNEWNERKPDPVYAETEGQALRGAKMEMDKYLRTKGKLFEIDIDSQE